jgi:acetyltransferase-like isoleucine patch superfamily enzyme
MSANSTILSEPAVRVQVEHPNRSTVEMRLKRSVQLFAGIWVTLRWLLYRLGLALFGRRAFSASSESIARIPGMRGVYLRQAFYRRTLNHCGQDVYFGWQSVFSMPEARVGERAYIGRFCSIGFADIGDEVMLADGVQILSGGREHATRHSSSQSMREQAQTFQRVCIGRGAWIGAGAVIMADVGQNAVVGAGAVVTRSIPPDCVAVGVPARVVKHRSNESTE